MVEGEIKGKEVNSRETSVRSTGNEEIKEGRCVCIKK